MNKLFKWTSLVEHTRWKSYMGMHMSTAGAQSILVRDLEANE